VPSSLPLRTDAGKLRQILLNLVGNAVKFSEGGEIVVEAVEEDGMAVFRVLDEGRGIAADRLQSIFVPFNRTTAGLDSSLGGVGLGLSVCVTLARLLRGTVTVESRLGDGSVFTLAIPMRAPVEVEDGSAPQPV